MEASPNIHEMEPRELIRGLMRGNRAEFKVGYEARAAVIAVKNLKPDADEAELEAYAAGFAAGMREPNMLTLPAAADGPKVEA